VRVLRRSAGRLRVHAPALEGDDRARIAANHGVRIVRHSERTANVLIEFDDSRIDEAGVLALIAGEPAPSPAPRARTSDDPASLSGWLRAKRSETINARPAECVAVLLEFEHYPQWQIYVTSIAVLERDRRGRGTRVVTRGRVGERKIEFTTSYRFPSANRVVFEQEDGELDGVRGSWAFRSLGGGRTRATYQLDIKPGRRLDLMLLGPLFEQVRDAVLDHVMNELRTRVEKQAAHGRSPLSSK